MKKKLQYATEIDCYSRMVEIGKDLWRSSGLIPLLKQGHPEQVAQDHVQVAFKYLQGGRLHNHSQQPVPVLSYPIKLCAHLFGFFF